MSYPKPRDRDFLKKLTKKKEFYELKLPTKRELKFLNNAANPSFLTEKIMKENKLVLHSHQLFVRNFLNVNTMYTRLLLKHITGTGKTIAALAVAYQFMQIYRQQYYHDVEKPTPYVFIIGFSKRVFQKELLRHPEFGFITRQEIEEHRRLKRLVEAGGPTDRDHLVEFETRIKKRFSKKGYGGFFKFFGYKQFFNRLFVLPDRGTGETYSEEEIDEGIAKGTILLNQELIDQFANSIIICDEIHNVYNSSEKNNYGIALQKILDIYDERPEALRIIFMSATPINNNPTEVIDLLNLLTPKSVVKRITGKSKISKDDFFETNRKLKPGALVKIEQLVSGRVSFLSDKNPKYFPKRILLGESIPGIPYLKFTRCIMSPFHLRTYKKFYTGTLPPDGQALVDFALPNPDDSPEAAGLGLFKTSDIKFQLGNASRAWKDENQIESVMKDGSFIITGEFMRMNNIKKYSTKYYKMLQDLLELTIKNRGKIMIYHYYVHISGAVFIGNLLRKNGFIDELSAPSDSTLCSICGTPLGKHTGRATKHAPAHDYIPARFVLIHSDIDKRTREISREKFNDSRNYMGHFYKILVGSKIIQESDDYKAVQHMMVMSTPNNIPSLLQIYGRAIRKNSHIDLPPEQRVVNIKMYISSLGTAEKSYEEKKYEEKVKDYKVIQEIEKILNRNAVDAYVNRDTIFPPDAEAKLAKSPPQLGDLYFKPLTPLKAGRRPFKLSELDTQTFSVWHASDEIDEIIYIIKRLFVEQSHVWKLDDLWKAVQNPPFSIEVNSQLFAKDNFLLALYRLVWDQRAQEIDVYHAADAEPTLIDQLFDPLEKKITMSAKRGTESRIVQVGEFYMLLPIRSIGRQSRIGTYSGDVLGVPIQDIDSWYRQMGEVRNMTLNITDYLRVTNVSYDKIKFQFYNTYGDVSVGELSIGVGAYGTDFHKKFIEDTIKYAFEILTNPNKPLSELHEFYFKMLYFYDKLNLVLFATDVEQTTVIKKEYEDFVDPKQIVWKGIPKDPKKRFNIFLMTTISKTVGEYRKFNIDRLNQYISRSRTKVARSRKQRVKVAPDMLPVGHFLRTGGSCPTTPRIYIANKGWKLAPEAIHPLPDNFIENDDIIGYFEKSPAGIDIKFKLRLPLHKIQKFEDSRKMARGAVCATKKKQELIEIVKSLGLPVSTSIKQMCQDIQFHLMNKELAERRRYRRLSARERTLRPFIKYFYLHFEKQPELTGCVMTKK